MTKSDGVRFQGELERYGIPIAALIFEGVYVRLFARRGSCGPAEAYPRWAGCSGVGSVRRYNCCGLLDDGGGCSAKGRRGAVQYASMLDAAAVLEPEEAEEEAVQFSCIARAWRMAKGRPWGGRSKYHVLRENDVGIITRMRRGQMCVPVPQCPTCWKRTKWINDGEEPKPSSRGTHGAAKVERVTIGFWVAEKKSSAREEL